MKKLMLRTVIFLSSFIIYWFFTMFFIPFPSEIAADSRITVSIASAISIILTIITMWGINEIRKPSTRVTVSIIQVILAIVIVYLIITA